MSATDTKWLRYVILLKKTGRPMDGDMLAGHIRHLRELARKGQLVMGGPFQNGDGGMLIIKAPSHLEARRIAESDPFVSGGIENYELRTWEISCEENNHLGAG
ncbi:MAG: hypothetical protein HKL90_13975 [Elusimicrobia bacterium]|nr:hypothetical protein [Elusimicrobiota bacterium]